MTDWVESWIHTLSDTSPETNGVAKCPFAKKAWDNNQVKVVYNQDIWGAVAKECDSIGEYRVVLCIQESPDREYEELEAGCDALNRLFAHTGRDIWLLSYQRDKAVVFIQSRADLNSASEALEKLGYYKNYTEEDFNRMILYRRICE